MPRWARAPLQRLALIALGLVLALVLAEVLLQTAAMVVRWTGTSAPAGWAGGTRRIVSLGDSNTYGLYLERDQAYPNVLERRFADDGADRRIEVLNLGFPGNNSSRVRHALPRILRELRPDVVTLMIGTNDVWTEPEPEPGSTAALTIGDRLYRHSRVYRLLDMVRRTLDPSTLTVDFTNRTDVQERAGSVQVGDTTFDWGWKRSRTGVKHWTLELRRNLQAMIDVCRREQVEVVLLTYPADRHIYEIANRVIRETAEATGAPLVDLAADFRTVCPQPPCLDWFFADNHPRARGHARVAERLHEKLSVPAARP